MQNNIRFRFNEVKTTQAACYFMSKYAEHKIDHMLLLKLLYLVDHRSIKKWLKPITGDDYYSMKYGPILSRVLDFKIREKESPEGEYWFKHITERQSDYSVRMVENPGTDELSHEEIEILDFIFDAFGAMHQLDLANWMHENLPEWKNPGNSRLPIKVEDIIEALTATADEEQRMQMLEEAEDLALMSNLLDE